MMATFMRFPPLPRYARGYQDRQRRNQRFGALNRLLLMPLFTCFQCGAQFPERSRPPASCPICEDERQFVNWKGQSWLSREEMAQRYKIVVRGDLGVSGLGIEPSFAIGQ